jgi:two-component system, chemotaxis family, protein-glutamate methylesterase/glutaminase
MQHQSAWSPGRNDLQRAEFAGRSTHSRVVPEIVAIGTSTGGPDALQDLLPQLPADLPVGVIIVQHMPAGFTGPLAKRLNTMSAVEVREAEHGDLVGAGTVYIAPAGRHITVERHGTNRELKTKICLSGSPLATLHRPSADVMMASVAELFGQYCCGIILTGMGNDGLEGMTAIHEAGGITIGQDQASSAVYGMPRVCAERGILQWVVPLSQMKSQILQALRYAGKNEQNGNAKSLHP